MSAYPDVKLFIDGQWIDGGGPGEQVFNPATEEPLGRLAHASPADLDAALAAAQKGFAVWRAVSAYDRSKIMRKAADLMRERSAEIGRIVTLEQGKPVMEATMEAQFSADVIEWFAEEGRRAYGRVIPARAPGILQMVVKEPVGPVAAFTPWNFPINQAVRKISGALAAGCSIVIKGPEETPASCAALIQAFTDAGVPAGVINLVFGVPHEVSSHLIPHPTIRKVTFTGSTAVGKQLAALAGLHMKRVTMELGGHAPALVFADANIGSAVKTLSANKFRNAGQVCVAPTRFMVQDQVFDQFTDAFVAAANKIKVGNGLEDGVRMGPLANGRRLEAMTALVQDAVQQGAELRAGGERIGNQGWFFQPTVLANVPLDARIMNEEPFGPVAIINRFSTLEEAVTESNRLPYGLAAYAYTGSLETAARISTQVESGMISINHHGVGAIETPFGGVKDSGYGSEGGSEAIEAYLSTKLVTQV
jgi:succinate-semialdehyde dehydrogenase/glutarate-semialdehyde dehydrogenase